MIVFSISIHGKRGMKEITYADRMEIIQQMLYWIHSRGEDKLSDLSVIYIAKGYPADYLLILEQAAKNIHRKYMLDVV